MRGTTTGASMADPREVLPPPSSFLHPGIAGRPADELGIPPTQQDVLDLKFVTPPTGVKACSALLVLGGPNRCTWSNCTADNSRIKWNIWESSSRECNLSP
ncbi:MAG: hypothetical protein KatS3mg111_3128 [Pirellulaceae bacterium]|nr:MAG: hypothetical protein KatS3mg111_3128 [Pirellulaceae bacterium]